MLQETPSHCRSIVSVVGPSYCEVPGPTMRSVESTKTLYVQPSALRKKVLPMLNEVAVGGCFSS